MSAILKVFTLLAVIIANCYLRTVYPGEGAAFTEGDEDERPASGVIAHQVGPIQPGLWKRHTYTL